MNKILLAGLLLAAISVTSADEKGQKAGTRPLMLKVEMLELPKKEEGKEQAKIRIFENRCEIQENEFFKLGSGGKVSDDSGSSLEWGEFVAGKLKLTDPQTVIVDLTISISRVSPKEFMVTGEHYQISRKLKIDNREVIMLTKPGEGRPRLLELTVSAGNR